MVLTLGLLCVIHQLFQWQRHTVGQMPSARPGDQIPTLPMPAEKTGLGRFWMWKYLALALLLNFLRHLAIKGGSRRGWLLD